MAAHGDYHRKSTDSSRTWGDGEASSSSDKKRGGDPLSVDVGDHIKGHSGVESTREREFQRYACVNDNIILNMSKYHSLTRIFQESGDKNDRPVVYMKQKVSPDGIKSDFELQVVPYSIFSDAQKERTYKDGSKSVYVYDQVEVGRILSELPLSEGAKDALEPLTSELANVKGTESVVAMLKPSQTRRNFQVVDATYIGAKLGENICDWAKFGDQWCIVVDGVEHGLEYVVQTDHPVFEEFGREFEQFVEQFDFDRSTPEEFKQQADQLVLRLHQRLHEKINEVDLVHAQEVKGRFNQALENLVVKDDCKEDLALLVSLVDNEDVRKCLADNLAYHDEQNTPAKLHEEVAYRLVGEFWLKGKHDEFVQELKKLEVKERGAVLQHISSYLLRPPSQELGRAGPAFGQAVFVPSGKELMLYTNHAADVGTMIIRPKKGEDRVHLDQITVDDVEWVHGDMDKSLYGLGASSACPEGVLHRVPPGTITFTMSDGIIEFATKEQVLELIQKYGNDPEMLVHQFKELLKNHRLESEDNRLDISRPRVCEPKKGCKYWDPDDKNNHDDITVVRIDAPAMAKPSKMGRLSKFAKALFGS